jgi:hypothetical protein
MHVEIWTEMEVWGRGGGAPAHIWGYCVSLRVPTTSYKSAECSPVQISFNTTITSHRNN